MVRGSSPRKGAFLGMPHGTATGRLRKMILFRLLQRLGDDICFRCDTQIVSIDELSIEHKRPWEGIDVDLFWDLDNIAFSHMKCNVPHRNTGGGIGKRKVGLEGTAWCVSHQDYHPVSDFYPKSGRWNGLNPVCIAVLATRDRRKKPESDQGIVAQR